MQVTAKVRSARWSKKVLRFGADRTAARGEYSARSTAAWFRACGAAGRFAHHSRCRAKLERRACGTPRWGPPDRAGWRGRESDECRRVSRDRRQGNAATCDRRAGWQAPGVHCETLNLRRRCESYDPKIWQALV